MTGIFPDTLAGGHVVRDAQGRDVTPTSVRNAYVPGPDYAMTCNPTALPSDCTARIMPSQINAIVSELLAFAEALDPDGAWRCCDLDNLAVSFRTWVIETLPVLVAEYETPTTLEGNAQTSEFTYTNEDGQVVTLARVSDTTGNVISVGPDGGADLRRSFFMLNSIAP